VGALSFVKEGYVKNSDTCVTENSFHQRGDAMRKKLETDFVIENLTAATLAEEATTRERHLYKENLRNLVRLAKSEQVHEIKESVRRLAGALEVHSARRRAKAVLLAQRLPGFLTHEQKQFEFKR
jgi:hypothetical protein